MASPLQDLIKQIQDLATDVGNLFQLRGFKTGGTTGQVPVKTNGTDFNWSWGDAGGATNLSVTRNSTTVTVASDTGNDAVIPAADGTNAGLMVPAQFTKLVGIEDGATADQDLSGLAPLASPTFTGTVNTGNLTTGGLLTFGTGTTFAFATGLDTGFRSALGLGALATVTPGTNVATALAIAADATGGIFRQGQALSASTVTASGAVTTGNFTSSGFIKPTYLRMGNTPNECHIYSANQNGAITIYNQAESVGTTLDVATSGLLKIRNIANNADSGIQCGNVTASGQVNFVDTATFIYREGAGVIGVRAANFSIQGAGAAGDGSLVFYGRSRIRSTANGMIELRNNANTDFSDLSVKSLNASGTVKTISYTKATAIATSHATAIAAGDGAQAYISDDDKPAWSNGTVWKLADGTTLA